MNFWRGAFSVVVSIFIFFVVVFRPVFLKSVYRGNYHLSRIGAASAGVLFFTIGIAGILNGLTMLSGVYVHIVYVLALIQFLAVGLYDSDRKTRLGSASPFYVKPLPGEKKDKTTFLLTTFVLSLAITIGLICIIHYFFPTQKPDSSKLLFEAGSLLSGY